MEWNMVSGRIRRLVTTTHGALSSRRAREVPLCEAATEPRCRRPPESAKRLPSRVADAHRNCSEAATQRCCAEALVFAHIFLVADANMLGVEQPHHGGEHGLPCQVPPPEVLLDAASQAGKRLTELQQALIDRPQVPHFQRFVVDEDQSQRPLVYRKKSVYGWSALVVDI